MCELYTRTFTGPETPVFASAPASTSGCKDARPSTWKGLVLFHRGGTNCSQVGLWLTRASSPVPKQVAGTTGGADLNDGWIAWRAGTGQLSVMRVGPGPSAIADGRLVPASGQTFQPPLVVQDGHLYFVHERGSSHFIARVALPLREPNIEHYAPEDDVPSAPEAPHFGVTAGTLYITNYPRPGGEDGSRVIMRIDEPDFERVEEQVGRVVRGSG